MTILGKMVLVVFVDADKATRLGRLVLGAVAVAVLVLAGILQRLIQVD